ncbi:MAG: imidazole glycerol phosphate synthase subunit HisF [Planctomycetota bacterium]|jgi:cyclase
MLSKRIIPCLDVDHGCTVKGVKFQGLREVGDPVDLARTYQDQGADELVFLDISATVEGRETMLAVVERVAADLMIPFTVGGGVSALAQVKALLARGADKVTVNSAAVARPDLVNEIARECGSQCCVLAVDAKKREDGGGWEVLTHGGRKSTGKDALEWAGEAVSRGAGEILLTSWDRDGTLNGFDLELTSAFAGILPIPVIASGGAGGPQSFIDAFVEGKADAALAASIFHDGTWTIASLKDVLRRKGIPVRI